MKKKSQTGSTTHSVAKAVKSKKSLDTKALVAFGLASLLPSFACADESIKKIQEVFDSQDKDSQKVKKLDGYSPVVDLRSSSLGREVVDGDKLFPFTPDPSNSNLKVEIESLKTPVIIRQDTTIGSTATDKDRWNVTTQREATKVSRNITIENNATLNINAHNHGVFGYRFAIAGVALDKVDGDNRPIGNLDAPNILWQGGTININFKMGTGGYGGWDNGRGALTAAGEGSTFTITSNLIFDYIDLSNEMGNAGSATAGNIASSNVGVVAAMNKGVFKLLGNKTTISINQFKDETGNSTDNRNRGLGGFALYAIDQGTVYLNAKDDGTVNDKNASIQVIGGISTSAQNFRAQHYSGGNIYAHFTGKDSFLTGNVYAGRSDSANNFSTLKMSFTDGATMTGNIVFSGDAKESTSDILFNNASEFKGKILDLGVGDHKVTFDATSFTGTIKRVDTEEELNSIGVISQNANHGIQVSNAGTSNSIITFKNTRRGQTFGNGTEDIVDTTYNGQIIGDFDVTTIKGGTDGSKGFRGSGKNTLTFDFNHQQNAKFTIGGGNEKSVYTLDRFKDLDLSSLDSTNHLYSEIEKSGMKIAAEGLGGTLQFRRTNIKVGEGDAALFASKANILGNANDLKGLTTLGATFGNAFWDDVNNDGEIGTDEIKASGANYKLTSTNSSATTGDANSSTGNIGNANDGVKKAINFIFTNGTYTFNGKTQGYTGTITGGTDDSQYTFVNAGFIKQEQVESRQGGELVLFNTAFKGDLGVKNKAESITLDFSKGQIGLIGNIVGSGAKNIVFNFTDNKKKDKYTDAVVGKASSSDIAKFTMLNLKTYSNDGTLGDGNGALKGTTIIEALKTAGLTNFNTVTQEVKDKYQTGTDIQTLSTTNTTIALRGTSLDASNMTFGNYVYDFDFGSGFTPFNGIAVEDSTLSGVIDLSSNANAGHSFKFIGDSFADGAGIKVSSDNTNNITLFFDDSDAKSTKTFKIDGFSSTKADGTTPSTNKITSGSLKFSKTNLEGNLFAGENVAVDLNFTNGRTWKMTSSVIDFKSGSDVNNQNKIIIHGDMKAQGETKSPELTLKISDKSQWRTLDMVNTGATLKLGFDAFDGGSDWKTTFAQSFNLRGTSLEILGMGKPYGNDKRLRGKVGNGKFKLVFAKGNQLDTEVNNLKITDFGTGEGNYIAESQGKLVGTNTDSAFEATFIGNQSYETDVNQINEGTGGGNHFGSNSKMTFANGGNLEGEWLGKFFKRDSGTATITLEGTTVSNANQIMKQGNQGSDKLTFNMTFIKDGTKDGYVDAERYGDLATTNANGALKDSILKVAESKFELASGLDFKDATYNILFAGEHSQNLSGTNFIEGGTENSTITFRNTKFNAGSDTNSSLRNIKGKVIFDLTHTDESSTITGTLSNMFAVGGKFVTKLSGLGEEGTNKLVFLNGTSSSLKDIGSYFADVDVFKGFETDYSDIAKIDTAKSSTLSFGAGTIAITNQDLVFIGADSHGFGNDVSKDATKASATTLGDSTGSTLTFIDAGTLQIANIQGGQGTINLAGSTKLGGLQTVGGKETLSLYKAADAGASTAEITGEGLTINAIFTGANNLGTGADIKDKSGSVVSTIGKKGSTANIGQADEKTTYHLLFDYTDVWEGQTQIKNQGFGQYWVYQGNIVGLTDKSVIKFKNAGYINDAQIAGTNAKILVDNTKIKGNFTGDNAVLDYRNNQASIEGNILTSDTRDSGAVLSRKELTFDFTGSSKQNLGTIQAGYKVAPNYTELKNSSLTFQNAPALSLGDDKDGTNTSTFIKAIANDIGFNIKDAKETAANFGGKTDEVSYILSGTELGFQGTNITATDTNKSITENLYNLNLSFDQRADGNRDKAGLGNEINKSSLTANSITMGGNVTQANGNALLSLSLAFHDKGSLVGDNTDGLNALKVNLANGAKFDFTADSTNGEIGTLILGENIASGGTASDPFELAKDSTLSIGAGSMSFIGDFIQGNTPSVTDASAGDITAHFDGTNKVRGSIKGLGKMDIAIKGDALSIGTATAGKADLTIDASESNAINSQITLAHTSGTVEVKGKAYDSTQANSPAGFTTLNLAGFADLKDAKSHTILGGAFNIGATDVDFGFKTAKTLALSGNTFLRPDLESGNSPTISLKDVKFGGKETDQNLNLTISVARAWNKPFANLNLINLDPKIIVSLDRDPEGNKGLWDNGSAMNIRGVNLKLKASLWNQQGGQSKDFVFADGIGTETTKEGKTLDKLENDDRINKSALLELREYVEKNEGFNFSGSMTFIGKDSLKADVANQNIDGFDQSIVMKFGFFNSTVADESPIFDNTTINPDETIYDRITLRGTDTTNLKVMDGTGNRINKSTIDAVFVKDSKITGDGDYISTSGLNEALTKTLEAYETTDAGGALSQSILKTLQSKATGNITMAGTVTATMKFIGDKSHDFKGATTTSILSGGNADSRFDFDHTNVNLDSIKGAGGKTYVYNSTIIGSIGVTGATPPYAVDENNPAPSTTLFFNAKMGEADTKDTQKLTDIAKNYIDYTYKTGLGINLDLTQDHKMSEANVNNGKLGATSKKTNIILIGQKAYKESTDKDGRTGLDLSFFDDKTPTNEQYKYTYTIISGGEINTKVLNQYNFYFSFIDTTLFGPRNFAQRDFIDTSKKEFGVQDSSWGGNQDIHQFLIFDFNQGRGYINNKGGNAIINESSESRYIFTNIFKDNNNVDRVLTLGGANTLKGAINDQLKKVGSATADNTIGAAVVGYLGLRGVSIEGNIDESTNGGNRVDIVFNSTGKKEGEKAISYIDGFDENKEHTGVFDDKAGGNYIANGSGISDISGYATLRSSKAGNGVTIKGDADKNIVFIGKEAVADGFDKLKIEGGTQKSNYTFHSVGTLSDTFLQGVGLQKGGVDPIATAGNFTFEASTIDGNINVNADPANKLTFKNVIYSGELSGNLKKDLHFAQGSGNITIKGGSDDSVYNFGDSNNPVDNPADDFSKIISIDNLNIDLTRKDGQANYYASKVKGFDGNTSLSGSLRLAKSETEVVAPQGPNQEPYSNSFTFKDNAKWTVTGQSRVMNLTLSNTGNSYNLEIDPLANQARMRNTPTQTPTPMLEVGTLSSTGGRALIWTDITSDQNQPKAATIEADTFKGTLYVAAKDKVLKGKDFKRDEANEIVLVEAGGVVGVDSWIKGESVKEGLRHSMTTLEHQEENADGNWVKVGENGPSGEKQRWVLDSFETQENKELVDEASSLISNPYRMLLIETNNLNKRMGELRDNDYAQGAWIRVFNGMDSGEGTKNFYTNVQLGYDYAFGVIGAKNYTGGAFSTSITDISGNQYNGKGNTYSIALYNSYIADNGLYVDAIAKYLYMDQRLTPKGQGESKFGNHAYSLGAEVGYRVPITETNFFVEAQGEVVGGIIQGMKDVKLGTYEGVAAWGDLETTPSLSLRAGIVAGYTLKTQSGFRADFRLGASLVSEFAKGGSVVLQDGIDAPIHSSIKNDNKVVLNLGTNLILTDKWRIYIDAERSFGGSRNTDYQASVGARFSFGKVVKSLPKDEIAPVKLKEEEKKDAQAQPEQEVKKEEVKAEQAPKTEKVEDKKADVKKTEAKKAETKAKKQPAKKQAKKQVKKQPAKKQAPAAKKAEAKTKNTNKTAQTGEKKGGWGWW